jgi:HK97 gp10 family phage protein
MALETQLVGLDPILKKLYGLSPKVQKKALNAAMRKGMTIVRKAAVAKAKTFDDPETPERIDKEIVVRSNVKKARRMGPGTFLVQVGVRGGAKPAKGNVWWWRLKEFGTVKMPADPFMRPALANNQETVINTVTAELDKAINKIIASGAA